jgi:hypothetical protein
MMGYSLKSKQGGASLLIFMMIIVMVIVATIYSKYNTTTIAIDRDKKTTDALKKAKEALIYYSLNNSYLNPSPACTDNTNCPRPGDLPCPDQTNDGTAGSSCGSAAGSNQAFRLSRLPWKKLGLEELTDGYGEHLWYAVSNNYKYNTRTRPLNSDTVGTITIRDSTGKVIYDATAGGGVVAVIFSPGNAIVRQDGYVQNRGAAGINIAKNYLDIAVGEDNSDFVDGTSSSSNGFIIGPVKDATGNVILNDRLIVITRDEMAAAMESYVLTQVREALLTYYNANFYYPYTSSFSDTTCLPANGNITVGCNSVSTSYSGRIPAYNLNQIIPTSTWSATSILRGARAGNWFQQNSWRELIYYAIAPDCEIGTINCSGTSQRLTLNNALLAPVNAKNVVVISAGKAIAAQSRVSKISELNYFEGENASPLDHIYSRSLTINNSFNDRAMSIP